MTPNFILKIYEIEKFLCRGS